MKSRSNPVNSGFQAVSVTKFCPRVTERGLYRRFFFCLSTKLAPLLSTINTAFLPPFWSRQRDWHLPTMFYVGAPRFAGCKYLTYVGAGSGLLAGTTDPNCYQTYVRLFSASQSP